ncbi:MAG TPA: rhodanese-like domain-containing protein [Gemmatimonadaceae bacterium]
MTATAATSSLSPTFSAVEEHPAADPADAHRHFLARLSVETDVSDVVHDLTRGTGRIIVLDVRAAEDYERCHVPGASSLPHRRISPESTAHLDREATLVTYCWGPACNAATKAAAKLAALGFKVKEMIGGLEYWRLEGCPVEGTMGAEAPLHWRHER